MSDMAAHGAFTKSVRKANERTQGNRVTAMIKIGNENVSLTRDAAGALYEQYKDYNVAEGKTLTVHAVHKPFVLTSRTFTSFIDQLRLFSIIGTSADLQALFLDGSTLNETFDPAVTTYTSDVSNEIDTEEVSAQLADSDASLTIAPSQPMSLEVGENVVTIEVVAEDGVTTKTYTVTITRAAE